MKKLLLIFLLFMIVPVVLASDSFNRYAWQEYMGDSDANSYLLRGVSDNTMNIDDYDYLSCLAGTNAGAYGVYPTEFSINGSDYTGLVVPTATSIHVISANCTDLDSIDVDGTIISSPFIGGYAYIDETVSYPEYVFLIKDSDTHIYVRFFSINATTSMLYLKKEIDTTLTDETGVAGLAGGCTDTMGSCLSDDRIYTYWNRNKNILYTIEGDESSPRAWNITADVPTLSQGGSFTITSISFNKNHLNIWMDDWDGDNTPEIILSGIFGNQESTYVYKMNLADYTARYDLSTHSLTKETATIQEFTSGGNQAGALYDSDMILSPCQIGSIGSALEYCIHYAWYIASTGNQEYTAVMDNDHDIVISESTTAGYKAVSPVTYDINEDGFIDFAAPIYSSLKWYSGLDYSLIRSYAIPSITYSSSYYANSFIYDMYPSHNGTGYLLSNGESWQLLDNGTAEKVEDWNSVLTNSSTGYITAGDINGDNIKELIFASTAALMIFRQDYAAPADCAFDIPTTNEVCQSLIDGFYAVPKTNNCTSFDILDCINAIGDENNSYSCAVDFGTTTTYCDALVVGMLNGSNYCSLDNINTCYYNINETTITPGCSWPIVSTQTICDALIAGYYAVPKNNTCTSFQILDCINAIPLSEDEQITAETGLPPILGNFQKNIKLIFGLMVILGIVAYAASRGIRNPIALILIGIVAVVLVTSLGLISTSVLVILLIAMVVLAILGLTLFKSGAE
jgi:hypothetical protein